MIVRRHAAATCGLLLAAGLSGPALAQGDPIPSGLVDPPLYVTNLSDGDVDLTWQTTRPGTQLSPPRGATVAAGAEAERIDPGLYWIVSGEEDAKVMVDNVVYLSVVDEAGAYVHQIALDAAMFTSLADVTKAALDVTVEADRTLTASPRLDDEG